MAAPDAQPLLIRIKELEAELDRFRKSEQFLQASESNLHLFARSLAHDFNNLLAGILGHSSLIASTREAPGEVLESAVVIHKAAERAAELASQMLYFTRGGLGRILPFDMHEIVLEIYELLHRTIDPEIALRLRLDAERPTVLGDPGQIHQMLLNLTLNARDAMPNGGEICIQTAFDQEDGLVLSVSDTGTGISKEIRDRVFQPFFTTKPAERGTGMGLAIVQRIVQNHGGRIDLETKVGRGTTFRIHLPHAGARVEFAGGGHGRVASL